LRCGRVVVGGGAEGLLCELSADAAVLAERVACSTAVVGSGPAVSLDWSVGAARIGRRRSRRRGRGGFFGGRLRCTRVVVGGGAEGLLCELSVDAAVLAERVASPTAVVGSGPAASLDWGVGSARTRAG